MSEQHLIINIVVLCGLPIIIFWELKMFAFWKYAHPREVKSVL